MLIRAQGIAFTMRSQAQQRALSLSAQLGAQYGSSTIRDSTADALADLADIVCLLAESQEARDAS